MAALQTATVPTAPPAPAPRRWRHRPRTAGQWVAWGAKWLASIVITVVALFPVWWMVNIVFAPPGAALALSPRLVPTSWSAGVGHIVTVMTDGVFARALLNSFLFAGSQSLLTLFIASLAAFCFAHLRFPGRRFLYGFCLVGLMIPLGVTVLPTQRIVSQLGWLNTVQGLVVPLTASAFALFLLAEYMRAVPRELVEAATVDGLGSFGIYRRIALPLCQNGLLAVGILVVVMAWSNFLWPLVAVTRPSLYPVSVAAATYFTPQSKYTTGDMMAAALLSALPLIIVYALLQRWIVDSISRAGLRG